MLGHRAMMLSSVALYVSFAAAPSLLADERANGSDVSSSASADLLVSVEAERPPAENRQRRDPLKRVSESAWTLYQRNKLARTFHQRNKSPLTFYQPNKSARTIHHARALYQLHETARTRYQRLGSRRTLHQGHGSALAHSQRKDWIGEWLKSVKVDLLDGMICPSPTSRKVVPLHGLINDDITKIKFSWCIGGCEYSTLEVENNCFEVLFKEHFDSFNILFSNILVHVRSAVLTMAPPNATRHQVSHNAPGTVPQWIDDARRRHHFEHLHISRSQERVLVVAQNLAFKLNITISQFTAGHPCYQAWHTMQTLPFRVVLRFNVVKLPFTLAPHDSAADAEPAIFASAVTLTHGDRTSTFTEYSGCYASAEGVDGPVPIAQYYRLPPPFSHPDVFRYLWVPHSGAQQGAEPWDVTSVDDCIDTCNWSSWFVKKLLQRSETTASMARDFKNEMCTLFEFWRDEIGRPHCELYMGGSLDDESKRRNISSANCGHTLKHEPRVFHRKTRVATVHHPNSIMWRNALQTAHDYLLPRLTEKFKRVFVAQFRALSGLLQSNIDEMFDIKSEPRYAIRTPDDENVSNGNNAEGITDAETVVSPLRRVPCALDNLSNVTGNARDTSYTCNWDYVEVIANAYGRSPEPHTTSTTTITETATCHVLDKTVPLLSRLHNLTTSPLDKDFQELSRALMNQSSPFYLPALLTNWSSSRRNNAVSSFVFTAEDMLRIHARLRQMPWVKAAGHTRKDTEDSHLPKFVAQWPFLDTQWSISCALSFLNLTFHNLPELKMDLWSGSHPHAREHTVRSVDPVEAGVELRVRAQSHSGLLSGLLPELRLPKFSIRVNLEFRDLHLHWRTVVHANDTLMRAALRAYDARCAARAIKQFTTTSINDTEWNLTAFTVSAVEGRDISGADLGYSTMINFLTTQLETDAGRAVVEKMITHAATVLVPKWVEAALEDARTRVRDVDTDTNDSHEPCTVREDDADSTSQDARVKKPGWAASATHIVPLICALWPSNCTDHAPTLHAFDDVHITLPAVTMHAHKQDYKTKDVGVIVELNATIATGSLSLPVHLCIHVFDHAQIFYPATNASWPDLAVRPCPGRASVGSLVGLTWLPAYGVLRVAQSLYNHAVPLAHHAHNSARHRDGDDPSHGNSSARSAWINVTVSTGEVWVNVRAPRLAINGFFLHYLAQLMERWKPTGKQDVNCDRGSRIITRASRAGKWAPRLRPHSLPPTARTILNTIVDKATVALTKDTLRLAVVASTELINNIRWRPAGRTKVRVRGGDVNDVGFTITRAQFHGISELSNMHSDLFHTVDVQLRSDNRVELFVATTNMSTSSHGLRVDVSVEVPAAYGTRDVHVRAYVTAAQLHVLLYPRTVRERKTRWKELVAHSPWCVFDDAFVDLFALELTVRTLCVSMITPCSENDDVELAAEERKYLQAVIATFTQNALFKKRVVLDTLCGNKHGNGDNNGAIANADNVGDHNVPLVNIAHFATDAMSVLAPLLTEVFRESKTSMPQKIPALASMLSDHSLFKSVTSLRNWTVTLHSVDNIAVRHDGPTAHAPSTPEHNTDDKNDNDRTKGILAATVTMDVLDVEIAVDVHLASNTIERPRTIKTRAVVRGLRGTLTGRPFVPRSAFEFVDADTFTPDWRCLLSKLRPLLRMMKLDIHHITSTTLTLSLDDRKAAYPITLPAHIVAQFAAAHLVGRGVFIDQWFKNIRCTRALLGRDGSSQRYHMAPERASLLLDLETTFQLAVRASSALVFNRGFFQSLVSACVQWFENHGGVNRITGTKGLFDEGAGVVDLQIVGGRIQLVTSTPLNHPITITLNNTVSTFRDYIKQIVLYLFNRQVLPNVVRLQGTRILQAHAVVDHIQFQLLFHVNPEKTYFAGKSTAWWAAGCALKDIDIDLAVLQLRVRRLCLRLSCVEDIDQREAALLRSVMATLMDAVLKEAFRVHMRTRCSKYIRRHKSLRTHTKDKKREPFPPPLALSQGGWEGFVRWGKNDLLQLVSTLVERSVASVRQSGEKNTEHGPGILSVDGMLELLHDSGRVVPLPMETSLSAGSDGVHVDVPSLVAYAPQKDTLTVSGCTTMNVTTHAERNAVSARINDTSWDLVPHTSTTNDILGLPTGSATLLQIRERSSNTWHHRRAPDFTFGNKSVRHLLRNIALDGTTTLTFAHAANASIRYIDNATTWLAARLDHVSFNGLVRTLNAPLLAMAEDVLLQEDERGTVVRAYARRVALTEWRYIWSTAIAESVVVDVSFDTDAYVVSSAPMPAMNGIYVRVSMVDGANEPSYSNGNFTLTKNGVIWEICKGARPDDCDTVFRSRTAIVEGTWDIVGLSVHKVATTKSPLFATVTLVCDDKVFSHEMSPRNISRWRLGVQQVNHNHSRAQLTSWARDKTSREHTSECKTKPHRLAPRLRIRIRSENTLLVVRRSTPTIGFDVLNADDVSLGARVTSSNATFSFQGAVGIRPKTSRDLVPFHVKLDLYDFDAHTRVFVKASARSFDIPQLLLHGLTECHENDIIQWEIHKLKVTLRVGAIYTLPFASPYATRASDNEQRIIFNRSLYIKPNNRRVVPHPHVCHGCAGVFRLGGDGTYYNNVQQCLFHKPTQRLVMNGTRCTLDVCGLFIAAYDVDQILLADLLNMVFDSVVLPILNKTLAPTRTSAVCADTSPVHEGVRVADLVMQVAYIFSTLGCLSVTAGFAYDAWQDGGWAGHERRRRRAYTDVAVFDSDGPLARHPVVLIGMRFALPLFAIALCSGLIVSACSPAVQYASILQVCDAEYGVVNTARTVLKQNSLWGTIGDLYANKALFLFVATFFFIGILPYCRCVLIVVVWCLPPHMLPLSWRSRLIHFMHCSGKYALIYSFLVFILVRIACISVDFHSSPYTQLSIDLYVLPKTGFFLYTACSFFSLILIDTVMRYHRQSIYDVLQRALPTLSDAPHTDTDAYSIMQQLATHPSTDVENPSPVVPGNLLRTFSLRSFHHQCRLAQRQRFLQEEHARRDSPQHDVSPHATRNPLWKIRHAWRPCTRAMFVRWMRKRWLALLIMEHYIVTFFVGIALICLGVVFFFESAAVTYGGLLGYLMHARTHHEPRTTTLGNAFLTVDHFFSLAHFGAGVTNAFVVSRRAMDLCAAFMQVVYFLTTLIFPSIVTIGCFLLWCTPVRVTWWPDIWATVQSCSAYSAMHVLVLTTLVEQFLLARFSGYLMHDNCETVTPLMDALFGHFFEGGCIDFVPAAQHLMVPFGACAAVVLYSVSLVKRRMEMLSHLVSATVERPHMALNNGGTSEDTTESVSTLTQPTVGSDESP